MPIYEYKCPKGHHFEVFHGMTEASPTSCGAWGAEPLQRVLHPVAVHYKGSGFYSTDYGRGGRKPSGSSDAGSSDSGSSDSGSSSSDGGSSSSSDSSSSPSNAEGVKKIKGDSGGGK